MHPSFARHKRTAGRMVANEPFWLRALLIFAAASVVAIFIIVPILYVFVMALTEGLPHLMKSLFGAPETRHAILLTLFVAPIAVALNTICGLAAAWSLTKFRFPGRTFLLTLIDLPFAISPVVAGLMLILLYGSRQGWFGPALSAAGIKIIFAWPGIVLATTFVTIPFVARELIPLMQSLGSDEELAAVSLGANPWQMFWRVTLPNIKWALIFGMIQCNARAIGEFGAVYVVSGRIAGETDTAPILINKLYESPGMLDEAYGLAGLLTLMALGTLVLKLVAEQRYAAALEAASAKEGVNE